jgi:DNA-binding IclR family transcriptional regulator
MSQSATHRVLEILELLASHPDGLGLAEISAELSIPKSVTHRLLGLLGERGYVRQDVVTGHYCLTLKLTQLGLRFYAGTGINELSQPLLDRLAAATGELARLAIVDGDRLVWVAKAQGARYGLRYEPNGDQDTGRPVFLHATATGKVWLASLDDDEALRIAQIPGLGRHVQFGPNVVRSAQALRKALRETRLRGFGLAIEEGEPGVAAIAVAVRASRHPDAATVATLSLAGPVGRFSPRRQQEFAELLSQAADELSAVWPTRNPLQGHALPAHVTRQSSSRRSVEHVR